MKYQRLIHWATGSSINMGGAMKPVRTPCSTWHVACQHECIVCLKFAAFARFQNAVMGKQKKCVTLPDLCVSSLRRGHANLLCIVPILTDDLRGGSKSKSLTKRKSSKLLLSPPLSPRSPPSYIHLPSPPSQRQGNC